MTTPTSVLDDLRDRLVAGVTDAPHITRPWTLVDAPIHTNCGDSALWLGERALARVVGTRVVQSLDRYSYDVSLVRDDTVIVINAGGNWGGLYPSHHRLRVRVITENPHRPVVQMPQSVELGDDGARRELREAVDRHGDVTLLVRDERSRQRAADEYGCRVVLVPDAAFALGALDRPAPVQPLVVQARVDRESPEGAGAATSSVDWLDVPPRSTTAALVRLTQGVHRRQARAGALGGRAAATAMDLLAHQNLRRGSRMLGAGNTVVTDRLHGHILCCLMGVPHVVVNDRFGKIEQMWSTWTHAVPHARYAPTWAHAAHQQSLLATA